MFKFAQHIKKVISRLYFFILRSKITEKQSQVRNFAWHRRLACGRDEHGSGLKLICRIRTGSHCNFF